MPTNPPTPRRYWAVTDAEGQIALDDAQVEVYADRDYAVNSCRYYGGKCGWNEVAIIPIAEHARLLAIEAAARNAMENSWDAYDGDTCPTCQDCTVLDPKDVRELREALKDA